MKRIGFISEMGKDELASRIMKLCTEMEQAHAISKPYVFHDIDGNERGPETDAGIILYLDHVVQTWKKDHE